MYRYIKHPKTNKPHAIMSVNGLNLLKGYVNQIGGKCSKCKKEGHNARSCTSHPRNIRLIIKPKKPAVTITSIKGPVSLYLWDITCPNGTNKKILLLGDEHTVIKDTCAKSNNKCYNIDSFLKQIITMSAKKNKCIDLFLEEKQKKLSAPLYLKGGELNKKQQLLHQIRNTFYECAWHAGKNPVIQKCAYKNLRFHNFDLRFSNAGIYKSRTSNKLDIILYNSRHTPEYKHARDFNLLADYILGGKISAKDMKRLNKIIYILSNSTFPISTPSYTKKYSVAEIKKDMTNFRRVVKKEYKKYLKTKNDYIPHKNKRLRGYIKYVIDKRYKKTNQFHEYTHLFTDLYILSRIFMEFSIDKDKISRSPKKCPILENGAKTINISPNKVLIIAGDDHINVYNEVLEYYFPNSLMYKTTHSTFDKHIKCKDILPKINNFMEIIEKFIE